jgi:hypothetical protein
MVMSEPGIGIRDLADECLLSIYDCITMDARNGKNESTIHISLQNKNLLEAEAELLLTEVLYRLNEDGYIVKESSRNSAESIMLTVQFKDETADTNSMSLELAFYIALAVVAYLASTFLYLKIQGY